MAETNSDTTVTDEDKAVTEEDLRELKYGNDEVETSKEADETDDTEETEEDSEEAGDEDGQTDDEATDESEETDKTESADEPAEYVKEFPQIKGDTLEDYARNLEKAYQNSSTEAMRLKGLVDGKTSDDKSETDDKEVDVSDPLSLYMKQKMDDEINTAFQTFSKDYPQVTNDADYAQFTREVGILSQTILTSQKRLAAPAELYAKAAVILGWQSDGKPSGKEKVGMAVKSTAAVSKTSSGTASKPKSKSKVTDAMLAANRLMYPGKSDAEIREELEPYI